MAVERWAVAVCSQGHVAASMSEVTPMRCPFCGRRREDAFEVVRAVSARSSDPSTSKQAALAIEPKVGTGRAIALNAITSAGLHGLTAREVVYVTGRDGIWKRISELKQGGHVVVVGQRTDEDSGLKADVYVAATLVGGPTPVESDPAAV